MFRSPTPHSARRRHGALPAAICRTCALQVACTTAPHGRSIALHPEEALLQQLRTTARNPSGRASLRRRTTIAHSLARLNQIQGPKSPLQRHLEEHSRRPPVCNRCDSPEPRAAQAGRTIHLLSSLDRHDMLPRYPRPREITATPIYTRLVGAGGGYVRAGCFLRTCRHNRDAPVDTSVRCLRARPRGRRQGCIGRGPARRDG